MPQSGNSSKVVWRGSCKVHIAYFLSLRDHCPLLPDVQAWKLSFHIFCLVFPDFFLLSFKEECKSNTCYSFHLCQKQESQVFYIICFLCVEWPTPNICVIDALTSFCLAVFYRMLDIVNVLLLYFWIFLPSFKEVMPFILAAIYIICGSAYSFEAILNFGRIGL